MPLPSSADQVVIEGFLLDEITGGGLAGEVKSEPVPLTGQAPVPMVLSADSHSHIQTRPRVTTPDPTSGYWALLALSTNDPDLEAYGGRTVTLPGQAPRTIEIPWNAPSKTVTTAMAAQINPGNVAGRPVAGDTVRAIWFHQAAGFVAPTPANAYLTSQQTIDLIASAIGSGGGGGSGSGDLPEYSPSAQTAAVTASGLTGKTTRFNTTSAAIAQPLPAAVAGRQVAVGWDAGANALTLTADGSDVIGSGSATSIPIPVVNAVVQLHCTTAGRWRVVGGHLPSSYVVFNSANTDQTGAAPGMVPAVSGTNPTTYALVPGPVTVPAALAGGSTSVRAQIQAIIDAARTAGARRVVVAPSPSAYVLDGPLKLYSDTEYHFYGAIFTLTTAKRFLANVACLAADNSVRDRNITIRGGTFARGALAGSGLDTMNLMLAFCDGIDIRDVTVTSTDGKYAVYLYNCNDFEVSHCKFAVSSDGVHTTGATRNGEIHHITGTTHDDSVAIMPRDALSWEIGSLGFGDVVDVWIHDIYTDTTCNNVKVLAGKTDSTIHRTDRITVERVSGQGGTGTDGRNCAVFIGADWNSTYPQLQGGRIGRVVVDTVEQRYASKQVVGIFGEVTIEHLELHRLQGAGFRTPIVMDAQTAGQWVNLQSLLVTDCDLTGAYTESNNNIWLLTVLTNRPRMNLGTVAFERIRFDASGYGGLIRLPAGSTERPLLTLLRLADVALVNGGALARIETDTEIRMRGVRMITPASGAVMFQAAPTGNAQSTLTITEAEGVTVPSGFQKVSKGTTTPASTIVSKDIGLPVGVAELSAAAGSLAFNTDAGQPFGAGPVAANGTTWIRLDLPSGSAADVVPVGTTVMVDCLATPQAVSATTQIAQQSGAYKGGVRRYPTEPASAGAYMSWKAPLTAGMYAVELLYRTGPNRGIMTPTVGSAAGSAIDAYAASVAAGYNRQTGFAVAASGAVDVRIDVTGLNASATAAGMELSAVLLTRTA